MQRKTEVTIKELREENAKLKQANEALKESEELYRKCFIHAPVAMTLLDPKTGGTRAAFNRESHESLGYSREEFEKMVISDTEHRESPGETADHLNRIIEKGFDSFETQLHTRDGKVLDMLTQAVPIRIRNRDLILSMRVDITDRKKMETSLQESEERYRKMFKHAGFAIALIDAETGETIERNKMAIEVTGYTEDESNTLTALDYEGAETPDEILDHFKFIIEKGSDLFETKHKTKTGESRDMLISAVPIKIKGKYLIHNIGVDITARKEAEKELKRYRDHLEDLVKERTVELETMQKEVLRSERLSVLGQLTATVAHEIRNPLGTIRSAVFSLNDAINNNRMEQVCRAIELAERNILRCDEIISELLNFTRKKELQKRSMDLDLWLKNLLSEQKIPSGILCLQELSYGSPVGFDSEQLRRAVVNILTNAIQAMEDEYSQGKELKITTREHDSRVEIEITDQGTGISDNDFKNIFEPLYSTKDFGVGLGMPIVKNIMEDHGGGIEISSKPGKGTKVILWLPLSDDQN